MFLCQVLLCLLFIMLNVFMLSVIKLAVLNADCLYADCLHAYAPILCPQKVFKCRPEEKMILTKKRQNVINHF
jgi:hypothetical protein